MRRNFEYAYMGVLIGMGAWIVVESLINALGGFNELNTQGVTVSLFALMILIVLRSIGNLKHEHTKLYIVIGVSVLFGGIIGIGAIVSIVSGVYMVINGVQHVTVIKELPSREEIKRARLRYLEGLDKELVEDKGIEERKEPKVDRELLEGFQGSDDHRQEIKTWIVEEEFNKLELTKEEVLAIARKELRENELSMETLIALEELVGKKEEEVEDLTVGFEEFKIEGLDLSQIDVSEEGEDFEGEEEDEGKQGEDDMDISLEDILGGKIEDGR